MACGRPVVVVAEGEPAALVREHRAGIVVRPGDSAGLVDALRTLSGAAALRQELGANGRHAAERLFDMRETDKDFIESLRQPDSSAPAVRANLPRRRPLRDPRQPRPPAAGRPPAAAAVPAGGAPG